MLRFWSMENGESAVIIRHESVETPFAFDWQRALSNENHSMLQILLQLASSKNHIGFSVDNALELFWIVM
jgi:hypothetical protein